MGLAQHPVIEMRPDMQGSKGHNLTGATAGEIPDQLKMNVNFNFFGKLFYTCAVMDIQTIICDASSSGANSGSKFSGTWTILNHKEHVLIK